VDSHSNDGTIEAIQSIGDNRIKIYSIDWLQSIGWAMYKIAKSMAIGRCTCDWCVLMDADEVFHEQDHKKIKAIPNAVSSNIIAAKFNTLHFYKDYNHLLNGYSGWKDLYSNKIYMVRNGLGIHHGNSGMDIDAHIDRHGIPLDNNKIVHIDINVFHYGHVRSDDAYLDKQNTMDSAYHGKTVDRSKIDWIDTSKLDIFTGKHPNFMESRIK